MQCRRSNSCTPISCTSRAIIESSWERILLRTKVPGSESSTANSLRGAKVPGSESSRERKFQGTKGPGSESSRERNGPGAKVPGNERARERKFQGTNWPGSYWNFRSRERIGPGAKRLGTASFIWLGFRVRVSSSQILGYACRSATAALLMHMKQCVSHFTSTRVVWLTASYG